MTIRKLFAPLFNPKIAGVVLAISLTVATILTALEIWFGH